MTRIITPSIDEIAQFESKMRAESTGIVDANGRAIESDNVGHFVTEPTALGAEKSYLRLHSDPVQEDNYNPKDVGTLARVLSFAKRVAPFAAAAAASVLIVPTIADASPLGNPLDDVSNSTPLSSYASPSGYGNLTGADGDVGNIQWLAVTDLGYAHIMDGANSAPVASIFTGISGLTGVALTGYDGSDFLIALSAGTTIYEGKLSQTAWTLSNTIDLTTSNLTDIDYALGSYFIATESDGIRKVSGSGTSEIDSGGADAYDVIVFNPNTYDNNMGQIDGIGFRNLDTDGFFLSGLENAKVINLGNWSTIQGVAHYGGDNPGMALVQNNGSVSIAQIYDPQTYQQHMAEIPEPATLTLLGLGALGLLGKKYTKQGNLFLPDNKE